MAEVQVQLVLRSASWDRYYMFDRLALEVFLRVQLAVFPPKTKTNFRESQRFL